MIKLTKKKIYTVTFIAIFLITTIPINELNKIIFEETNSNLQFLNEGPRTSAIDDEGSFLYVIITSRMLESYNEGYSFHYLLNYKSYQDITGTIVTVEDIDDNYGGYELQDKIRNFIIDVYNKWGTRYILLGGDSNIIPPKYFCTGGAPMPGDEWEPEDYDHYTDQYYSTIHITWDDDNDRVYGEEEDWNLLINSGKMGDIYLGRAPVGSTEEVYNFVRKTILHESQVRYGSNLEYLYSGLMAGEFVGMDMDFDPPFLLFGADCLDQLYMYDSNSYCNAHGYQTRKISNDYNFETLYERDGTYYDSPYVHINSWTKSALVDIIEGGQGVHILNYHGRPLSAVAPGGEVGGWIDYDELLGILHDNLMQFNIDTIASIANDNPFFLLSYQSSAFNFADEIDQNYDSHHNYVHFSHDSIGERFITSPNGAFAAIGDISISPTSYLSSDLTDDFSQMLIREFYDAIFRDGIDEIGRALQVAKEEVFKRYYADWGLNWQKTILNYFEVFGDPMAILRPKQESIFDIDEGPHDYVIITNEALKNSNGEYNFQDLTNLKSTQGYSPKIITIEEINAEYGHWMDGPEKIREFIKDAYGLWDTRYILLGGDDHIVPIRYFESPLLGHIKPEANEPIPSDQYYASLDGSWDHDGDRTYGEEADWEAFFRISNKIQVAVGRTPVSSEEDLSNFMRKTLLHEQEMRDRRDDFYLYSVLNLAEHMGVIDGIDIYGGDCLDELNYNPKTNGLCTNYGYITRQFEQYYNNESLYERDFFWTKDDLISFIERDHGVHIINQVGHGIEHWRFMKLDATDVNSLNNTKYPFIFAGACNVLALDKGDSIGEHWLTFRNGSFAIIGNTRLGASATLITDCPDQNNLREFYNLQFGGIDEIGRALQGAKQKALLRGETRHYFKYSRYKFLSLNLFGDPTAVIIQESEPADLVSYDNIKIVINEEDIIYEDNNVTFSYEISSGIRNMGGKNAGRFSNRFIAWGDDVHTLGEYDVNELSPNNNIPSSRVGRITLPYGEYRLLHDIDCNNDVYELEEGNNFMFESDPLILAPGSLLPDITSNDIDIIKSNVVIGDDEITFSYIITSDISNEGYVGATQGFNIQYTAKNGENVYVLGEYYIDGLSSNEIKSAVCEDTITLPFGEYEITCNVDYDGTIIETDDDNNVYNDSYPLIISQDILMPDFVPYNDIEIILSDISLEEDEINFYYGVSAYVKNCEWETTEEFWIYYALRNGEKLHDLGYMYVDGLDQNEIEEKQGLHGWMTIPYGDYEIISWVDYDNQVVESNEDNNIFINRENLTFSRDEYAPDFSPIDEIQYKLSDVTIEDEGMISFTYDLSTYISNFGYKYEDRIYFSFDLVNGDEIFNLDSSSIYGLDTYEIRSIDCRGKITIPYGEYELVCTMDHYNRVVELNENNNVHINFEPLELTQTNYLPDFYCDGEIFFEFNNIISGADEISFSYDLWTNIGNYGYGTTQGFYIQLIIKGTEEDYILGEYYLDGLNHNELEFISCNGTITLPSGYYELMCIVDCYNNVLEMDEENNIYINSDPIMGTAGSVRISSVKRKIVGEIFNTHIYVDSGNQKVAAYSFNITFNRLVVNLQNITTGSEGFISAIDIQNSFGWATVSGFNSAGVDPSSIIDFLIITWKAIEVGESELLIDVLALQDETANVIGSPYDINSYVKVIGNVRMSSVRFKIVGDIFDTQVYINSGSQKVSGYFFNITFNPDVVIMESIAAGLDGFINSVNIQNSNGWATVTGYNEAGIDPSIHLRFLKIIWKAIGVGESELAIDVLILQDETAAVIGTPYGVGSHVTVILLQNRYVTISDVADKRVGDIFDTQVYVDSGIQKVAAYNFNFTFNPTVINIEDIVAGPDGFISFIDIQNIEGWAVVSGFDASGVGPSSNLSFLTITWKAIATGESVLAIDVLILVDESTADIGIPQGVNSNVKIYQNPSSLFEGKRYFTDGILLTWIPTSDFPGTYQITRNGELIQSGTWNSGESIHVEIIYDETTIGIYTYDAIFEESDGHSMTSTLEVAIGEQPLFLGDVNNDGFIDIIDALETAQYYVGMNIIGFHPELADVNADGSIDIVDALLIAQYYVGLINQFPAEL